ncbi:sigma-70 family RNA polymerase sigma factor [Mesobacillus selenatarsenatis]|uniref:CDS_ID OB2773 n=1 Tax=Mesobacillus selenatarsenatis (strain DSM 18680 / JCM 14380 / FERM P-15431 / SF-1) TaxID=1321606 RepID=A0A0A8X6T2_MESS1|nr:sigma-70 family RNA polymerase sigma factor [Mesobacillus selenatarsenatis]GAM14752.1 CDS_ID OB2773 [Mesobacillus selenatarsenatis SF-1]
MESFEQLSRQYEPMIHKIISSLNIYKNKEDYFHTGLVGLWEAAEAFDPEKGDFTNYAYSYIKGQILNEMNRNNRFEERSVYPKEEYWETVEEPNAKYPLELDFLLSYCEDLTEKETKWVIYTCVHFLSVREIAEKENVSLSAVKQWRSGAKKKLKEQMIEVLD